MTHQEEYQRAIGMQHYETRKMKAVRVPVSREEKLIYTAMVVTVVVTLIGIATQNGWL